MDTLVRTPLFGLVAFACFAESLACRPARRGASELRATCGYGPGEMPRVTVGDGDLAGLRSKIHNIIVVVQENRSLDHLYGRAARARPSCPPTDHGCVEGWGAWRDRVGGAPVRASTFDSHDPKHHWAAMHGAWNNGKMDDFVSSTGPADRSQAITYYLPQDHPFYSWIFDQFATSDAHYAPILGPTWPNRDYLIWGSAYGMTDNTSEPPKSAVSPGPPDQGIFTELHRAGVSFRLYWTESKGQAIQSPYEGALGWTVALGDRRCARPPAGSNRVDEAYCTTPSAELERDVANGTLPSVAFYESSEDEHPGNSGIHSGEDAVRRVMASIMRSPRYWPTTAVVLTYDEGGGFFDHKPPPKGCDDFTAPNDFSQRGMRVPLIVVSAWAKKGYVSHETSDHASVLRLIQARWDLPAMTRRDANANALLDLFEWTGAPAGPPGTIPASGLSTALGDRGDGTPSRDLARSLWNDEIPTSTKPSAAGAFELGVEFASTLESPHVVGLKYWVGDRPEIGVDHIGRIWDVTTRSMLVALTFPEETEQTRGTWQTAYLETPLPIARAHLYVASRNTRRGGLFAPSTTSYFLPSASFPSPVPNASDPNVITCFTNRSCAGVAFGSTSAIAREEGTFPTIDSGGDNYWVDVLIR
jgi:phospholipase C